MTRKSRRDVERDLDALRDGDEQTETFIQQALAVAADEREQVTVSPPSKDFLTLVAAVAKAGSVSLADAHAAVATADGVEPEPLADFTEADT
ncbi:hypothetical protein [Haloplanus pelagicus]|jgi:hypothetical protein|uniref:hypothetical protein n=1 Tax=Haloplanus pelagicus TaxID=2949995 RepID=UPI00203DC854|nr:hypothetical protein [Haloplanus sp. HW8-1]